MSAEDLSPGRGSVCVYAWRTQSFAELTIIVPTFRRPDLIRMTLDSLVSQTNRNFEVLVVDNDFENCCDLDSVVSPYLEKLNLALFRNSLNLGMYGNWDRGLSLSRTKWISILHDDDLVAPSFVSESLDVLSRFSQIGLLLFRSNTFLGNENPVLNKGHKYAIKGVGGVRRALLKDKLYKISAFDYFLKNEHTGTLGTVFLRRGGLKIGGFEHFAKRFGYSADYAFFVEYCRRYNSSYICNKTLGYYRLFVNESLKFETIIEFIDKSRMIRTQIQMGHVGKRGGNLANALMTAYQVRASIGLGGRDFCDKFHLVLARYELSKISYFIFQSAARFFYNVRQLYFVISSKAV